MADTVGMQDIRGLNVNKIVTGFALQKFILKPLLRNISSSKWQERYYQETAADLTATAPSYIKGIGRLSVFPLLEVSWTQVNSYHKKHGAETVISWEDALSNDVPVIERSLLRIARAVAKSVDDHVYSELVSTVTGPLSGAATIGWASASANIPLDVNEGIRAIQAQNYDTSTAVLVVNSRSFADMKNYLTHTKGASVPAFASSVVQNGKVMEFMGLSVIQSQSVAASGAFVLIPQECGNYLQLQAQTTETIPDPGIKYTIRSWEIGQVQITNPDAVYFINGV